jgi:cell division protein ZapA (FtsZ GTPase activity inhibitor)
MQHSVDVTIRGRTFNLACPKGQESRLLHLADQVTGHLNAIGRQVPHANEMTIMAMGLLTMADKMAENELNNGERGTQEDIGLISGQLEKMAARVVRLTERFAV